MSITENQDPCSAVCPGDTGLELSKSRPNHLPERLWPRYQAWGSMPYAPYPPGGTPEFGIKELRISADEWARRARQSPCYRCEFEQRVKNASRLRFGWMFWTGLGAGALGLGMLAAMRFRS